MKRKGLYTLIGVCFLLIVLVVVNANKKLNETDVAATSEQDNTYEEEFKPIHDETKETEKELYARMLNSILNEYDEEYEAFDLEAGTKFYELVRGIANEDIDVAINMKDSLLESLEGDEREVYSKLFDDLVELEDTFSHLEWER